MSCAVRQVLTTCSQGSAAGGARKVSSASSGRHSAYDLGAVVGSFSGGSLSEGLLGKQLSGGSAAGGSFGAPQRACSALGFGGAGICARGTGGGFGRASAGYGDWILFANNEKATMQNLNDRLASYLDKVRLLEGDNADLECKIREWYAKVGPSCEPRDYSCYHKEIEDLQNQILCAAMETNKILLNIDNNRMTADDFRVKYETECGLRQNVDTDISNLRPVLDQLASCKTDLQLQCEALTEEMCCLKTNHEEEMSCLRKQATGDVSVEVNACPGPDLRKILEDLRCQYETLMERNRKETEQWYACKVEEVNLEVITSSQEIESSNKQVTELRRQLQALEINVQAQLTMKENLESSLAETECRYNRYLAELQGQISCVEQRLAEIREEMECQNQEYKTLLDVKCRLEQEIQTYHCLLEGGQHDIIGQVGRGVSAAPAGRSTGLKASLCQPCLP
ncbi:keratin, type I cytoskeletal 19-like [Indicator indicator]|uniref:keratin, type I cytoskeletal 19-like n=1 Tax=Indicator indicator TaxID=1002788 RepID=UPI0023E0244A|nr:keratin, type I cytoskeletal 19-like [Indicator indicator]